MCDDISGGYTDFHCKINGNTQIISVKPETGLFLIFEHFLTHSGQTVKQGIKYVMRTGLCVFVFVFIICVECLYIQYIFDFFFLLIFGEM